MNQCPPSTWVFHKDHLDFFRKFAEIIANECSSAVSTTPAIKCSAMSTTPLTNLLAVSLTPAINLCHGFSLIGGVVDTSDKFIADVIDTAEKWLPVTTTPMINFLPVSTPVNNYRRWQQHWRQIFCQYQRHRWTMIAGDNDTGDKFFNGINHTGVVHTGHK